MSLLRTIATENGAFRRLGPPNASYPLGHDKEPEKGIGEANQWVKDQRKASDDKMKLMQQGKGLSGKQIYINQELGALLARNHAKRKQAIKKDRVPF